MIIASWNVNSIKMRLPLLLEWLKTNAPDVVCLQELKCESDSFPALELQGAGYHALVKGQKAYNGVAILTREKATLRTDVLAGDDADVQARYIEAEYGKAIIACIYLPNGNPLGTDKFPYKLSWMKRLYSRAHELFALERPVMLCGDFNVIPEKADAKSPSNWTGDALFQPESRAAFRRIEHVGFTDAFRALHPQEKDAYTFWDYQAGAWPRDEGIRIDHILCSPEATDILQKCWIDRTPRGAEKASDHTPILAKFNV